MLEIIVYGSPAPQGSKRFVGMKNGRGIMIESSKKVRPWRQDVKEAAIKAMGGPARGMIKGPVRVEMTFTLPKPKSAPKRRQSWPDKKPDLSKLVRSTEDSLCEAGAIEDDARIVLCLCRKVFPGEHPEALDVPGAIIKIREIASQLPV